MVEIAALLAFAAVWHSIAYPTRHRLGSLTGAAGTAHQRKPLVGVGLVDNSRRRARVCVLASTVAGWAVGGRWGAAVGVLAGVGLTLWLDRLESPEAVRSREEISRDLPLAIDLLAACAAVGQSAAHALSVTSRAIGGPLGQRFDGLQARLALGADPLIEWTRLGEEPQLAPLARTMVRTLQSGAPVTGGLTRLADDIRRDRRTQSQLKARNVGVKAAGPLALCFLPAFMAVGVVPTVAGAFEHLLM